MIEFLLTVVLIWIVLRVAAAFISLPFRFLGALLNRPVGIVFLMIITILIFSALRKSETSGVYRMRDLYRSRTDKWLAGVCGGIGACFGVNANLIRAIFAVLAVLGGGTIILAYLIAALIIPLDPYL